MISPVHESLRQSAADSLYIVGQFVPVIVRQPALPDDRSTSDITLLFNRCHKPLSSIRVLHVLLATLKSPQLFKYGLAGRLGWLVCGYFLFCLSIVEGNSAGVLKATKRNCSLPYNIASLINLLSYLARFADVSILSVKTQQICSPYILHLCVDECVVCVEDVVIFPIY